MNLKSFLLVSREEFVCIISIRGIRPFYTFTYVINVTQQTNYIAEWLFKAFTEKKKTKFCIDFNNKNEVISL